MTVYCWKSQHLKTLEQEAAWLHCCPRTASNRPLHCGLVIDFLLSTNFKFFWDFSWLILMLIIHKLAFPIIPLHELSPVASEMHFAHLSLRYVNTFFPDVEFSECMLISSSPCGKQSLLPQKVHVIISVMQPMEMLCWNVQQ